MVRAALALGANLGNRAATLGAAARQLSEHLAGTSVSAFIETDAEGVGEQPAFLNGAVAGSWEGSAHALLDLLMGLERAAGRQRPYPGAPRTLDLDLILFGGAIIDEPGLIVPHPRFRERGFVLQPLAEVAPDMVDPVTGLTLAELFHAWQARSTASSITGCGPPTP
jgi:2-amino-4-hydroxy-6-hydroxymethyldihydropteridine diphosphokinase